MKSYELYEYNKAIKIVNPTICTCVLWSYLGYMYIYKITIMNKITTFTWATSRVLNQPSGNILFQQTKTDSANAMNKKLWDHYTLAGVPSNEVIIPKPFTMPVYSWRESIIAAFMHTIKKNLKKDSVIINENNNANQMSLELRNSNGAINTLPKM